MVSPLKRTRIKKQEIIADIVMICFRLIKYPKGSLDRMDYRKMSNMLKKLKELEEAAKPC